MAVAAAAAKVLLLVAVEAVALVSRWASQMGFVLKMQLEYSTRTVAVAVAAVATAFAA